MAQSVKPMDFGSGHDLAVHKLETHIRLCTVRILCLEFSLSSSISAPPLLVLSLSRSLALSLSLSQNKKINLKKKKHLKYNVLISITKPVHNINEKRRDGFPWSSGESEQGRKGEEAMVTSSGPQG